MIRIRTFRPAILGPAVLTMALLTGCSGSASVSVGGGTPQISGAKLGKQVAKELAASTGQPTPTVKCPHPLIGKVRKTTRCTLIGDDQSTVGLTVTVTAVDDSRIHFHVDVDDTATPGPYAGG
jgi:hypothetical protein